MVPNDLDYQVPPLRFGQRIRNLIGFAFMLVTTLILFWPIFAIIIVLKPLGLGPWWLDFTVWWWTQCLALLWGVKVDVHGLENIKKGQAYVIACNHRSNLDAVALSGALFPVPGFAVVIKRALALIPLWGWFIWMGGYIPVNRSRLHQSRNRVSNAVHAVKKGRSVLFFPEGTRAPSHRFLPFKKGAVNLAIEAQVPVLPITVSGTGQLLPKSTYYARPGRVRLDIHEPMSTEGLVQQDRNAMNKELERIIAGAYRVEVQDAPALEEPALMDRLLSRGKAA
jgi:1-acyl-sn-glycerol-3-phosphate acyltransferase